MTDTPMDDRSLRRATVEESGRFGLPAWLALVCICTFTVLLLAGAMIYRHAPPVFEAMESPGHQVILSRQDIEGRQASYPARGGQDIGRIWGLASAGALRHGDPGFEQADGEALDASEQAGLRVALREKFKTNRFDHHADRLAFTSEETQALDQVFTTYANLLADGSAVHAIPRGWFKDPNEIRQVTAFFTWTSWAAAANRPNAPFSYTANFPHDPLIGNQPPLQILIWSIVSVIVLIAALLYTNHTHQSVAEYWRWWVVHLWVEGFFEVFATGSIVYLCMELGFIRRASALRASCLSTIPDLGSGVIGTLHHLSFAGTSVLIAAVGAVASALEVVPLTLVGSEVVKALRFSGEAEGFYRVPLRFFLGTCCWNLAGAAVFGFLINPPIILYYYQGINTTPIHSHSALVGVYGNLAIALLVISVGRALLAVFPQPTQLQNPDAVLLL